MRMDDEIRALEHAHDMLDAVCGPFHLDIYKIRGRLLTAYLMTGSWIYDIRTSKTWMYLSIYAHNVLLLFFKYPSRHSTVRNLTRKMISGKWFLRFHICSFKWICVVSVFFSKYWLWYLLLCRESIDGAETLQIPCVLPIPHAHWHPLPPVAGTSAVHSR